MLFIRNQRPHFFFVVEQYRVVHLLHSSFRIVNGQINRLPFNVFKFYTIPFYLAETNRYPILVSIHGQVGIFFIFLFSFRQGLKGYIYRMNILFGYILHKKVSQFLGHILGIPVQCYQLLIRSIRPSVYFSFTFSGAHKTHHSSFRTFQIAMILGIGQQCYPRMVAIFGRPLQNKVVYYRNSFAAEHSQTNNGIDSASSGRNLCPEGNFKEGVRLHFVTQIHFIQPSQTVVHS